MDTITFKQLEDGQIVKVITNTITEEVPFSKEEIKRQINEHSQIVSNLQLQLQALEEFEKANQLVQEVQVQPIVNNPIINEGTLSSIISNDEEITNE